MERIVFTYDKEQSRKNSQFTVVLTQAENRGKTWERKKGSRIFFVKDLEFVAAHVPDRTLFRTALESEMGFRKTEGRFFSRDQEFTALRIAAADLFHFITGCQNKRFLIHPDGSPTAFRISRDVIPEISPDKDRLKLYLDGKTLADQDYIVKTMPVTLVCGNHIAQLRQGVPFSLLKDIPTDRALSEKEREQLFIEYARHPDRIRIRSTGKQGKKIVKNAGLRAVLNFESTVNRAELFFIYSHGAGEIQVRDRDSRNLIFHIEKNVEIHRNSQREDYFRNVLLGQGFFLRSDEDYNWLLLSRSLESVLPVLEQEGFTVKISNSRVCEPVKIQWKISADPRKIRVGGTVISGDLSMTAEGLFQAFQEKRSYVMRPDGACGLISDGIRQIISDLSAGGAFDKETITFNSPDFTTVSSRFEGVNDVETDDRFEDLKLFARKFEGIRHYAVPPDLTDVLRPYQVHGYNWLRTMRDLGLHGILADDMGLGKTLQVLALIKSLVLEGQPVHPVLLIVPKTLIFNWEIEIKKFAPELSFYVFSGSGRLKSMDFLDGHHIILTSYGLLRSEITLFCSMTWDYVILDEANAIKNADAMISKAVKQIGGASRLTMTGTPVENSATDLWSQFDFLMPGFLGNLASFKETYGSDQKRLEELRVKTKPYILRRLKSQVLKELPPKTDVTLYCDFAEDQKALYEKALREARDEMADLKGGHSFKMLRLILRLRQIACPPQLALKNSPIPFGSGKMDEVYHSAMEILSEGHKILIFSQFTRHLKMVEDLFVRKQTPVYYLDGQTRDREGVVQGFKNHRGPCLFFISLKTGGTGLNLSEATYVFLLDPWWNPAVENQAIDRCHRMGQQQPVTVYRFITRGSIEEKVNELKTAKKQIEEALIDEAIPRYTPDEQTLKHLIISDV